MGFDNRKELRTALVTINQSLVFVSVGHNILRKFCNQRRYARAGTHSPNLSVISTTSQLIFKPFRRFTYVTSHSPILPLLHLRHSSFSNPSFPSPTSQALHLMSPGETPMPTRYFYIVDYSILINVLI